MLSDPTLPVVYGQDIEITRGYVPGYNQPMGHEFVGTVVECSQQPELVGSRVVGEININCARFSCADAVFQRNHAPDRCVYTSASAAFERLLLP